MQPEMSNIYESMRSIYRVVRAANGPGERHEYTAALCLSVCWVFYLGGVLALAEKWIGNHLIAIGKLEALALCLAIFLIHYLLLIRGRSEDSFASRGGPRWAGAAALAYIVCSVLFFVWAVDLTR